MSGIVFCPYNQNGCLGVNKPIILPTIQCAGDRQIDSWFLTPSQPWRLYQGELCAWEKAKSIWGIKSASHLSPNLLPPTQCVWEIQPDLMYKISEPFKPESPTYHSVCRGGKQPNSMYKISKPCKPKSPTYHLVCREKKQLNLMYEISGPCKPESWIWSFYPPVYLLDKTFLEGQFLSDAFELEPVVLCSGFINCS